LEIKEMATKFDIKEILKYIGKLANVVTIFKKELRSYFNSAVAYVVIVVFLAIVGWIYTSSMFLINVASLRLMFEWIPLVFLFVVPAITMRLLAEEKKAGTIELLATKPLHDWEVVLGKFFAAWALVGLALLPTLLYYMAVISVCS
jgi:ABC-2 type transport system permease protein